MRLPLVRVVGGGRLRRLGRRRRRDLTLLHLTRGMATPVVGRRVRDDGRGPVAAAARAGRGRAAGVRRLESLSGDASNRRGNVRFLRFWKVNSIPLFGELGTAV